MKYVVRFVLTSSLFEESERCVIQWPCNFGGPGGWESSYDARLMIGQTLRMLKSTSSMMNKPTCSKTALLWEGFYSEWHQQKNMVEWQGTKALTKSWLIASIDFSSNLGYMELLPLEIFNGKSTKQNFKPVISSSQQIGGDSLWSKTRLPLKKQDCVWSDIQDGLLDRHCPHLLSKATRMTFH